VSAKPEQEPARVERVPLGQTGVRITPLGIGAWAWGDRLYWGFGRGYAESDVRTAYETSRAAGINFFDTAESYGRGRSERLLGEYVRGEDRREELAIATKFFPYPWRLAKGQLLQALRGSLERLGLEQVDLYQMHSPFPPVSIETWMEAMAAAVQAGLARAVGVSNYNAGQMRRAVAALDRHGLPLAANQVDYSLLNRRIEQNGVLALCRELGVTVIAYSPLAQGLLTGKYTPEHPPGGMRGARYRAEQLARIQPLIRLMREIGREHEGKSAAQVALNWTICKGTVPIPGAKNARQAGENAGALGWRLEDAEVEALDRASREM
jgi:aryl-alcohol dehydrogenase-like predicted oxidoreductase